MYRDHFQVANHDHVTIPARARAIDIGFPGPGRSSLCLPIPCLSPARPPVSSSSVQVRRQLASASSSLSASFNMKSPRLSESSGPGLAALAIQVVGPRRRLAPEMSFCSFSYKSTIPATVTAEFSSLKDSMISVQLAMTRSAQAGGPRAGRPGRTRNLKARFTCLSAIPPLTVSESQIETSRVIQSRRPKFRAPNLITGVAARRSRVTVTVRHPGPSQPHSVPKK